MPNDVTGSCECSYLSVDVCSALQDVAQVVCEQGTVISYIKRSEEKVERDALGTIKKRSLETKYRMKAFPVERQPNRKQLERAGIREDVDTIVYIPTAFFIEQGIIRSPENEEYTTLGDDFAAIEDIRSTVILDGSEWKIKDKGMSGRLQGIPLYITFGLHK